MKKKLFVFVLSLMLLVNMGLGNIASIYAVDTVSQEGTTEEEGPTEEPAVSVEAVETSAPEEVTPEPAQESSSEDPVGGVDSDTDTPAEEPAAPSNDGGDSSVTNPDTDTTSDTDNDSNTSGDDSNAAADTGSEEVAPAEEQPADDSQESDTPEPIQTPKKAAKAPAKAPAAGSYEITSSDINSVKTYVQKTTSSGSTWEETTSVGDGDAVKFDIKYHIGAGSVTNGKLHYKLPSNITNLDTNSTLNVVDGNDPTKTIGTYKITKDGDDYYVEIELDSSKIDYTNAFDGTISVEGIAKNNKSSGNDTIDFGGSHTVTVSQDRTISDFSLRKQGGSRTPDANGGGTISFEYFLGSYNGTNTININDVATAQNVDIDFSQDVTITYSKGTYKGGTPYPENFGSWGSGTSFTVSGANFARGVNYTLPALDAMQGYWVRYTVPYKADSNDDGESKKVSNTVKASTANAPDAQSSAGTEWDKPTIKKTSTKPSNNKATWTITIGESGQDLSGFKLKDVLTTDPAGALNSLNIQQPKTMTITNINGNAANKKINLTNGEYTFPEGTTGYIVLKYTTTLPIIPSSTVKLINTATLTTDEGTQTAVAEEEFVGIPGQYALSKLGPDELDGGDTTNTAIKDGDDITMSWQSTITLPGAGRTANLEDIYYYDYTEINGSSSSSPTNNWVTKNTLKDDLVITNSSGQTLERGVDYIVYTNWTTNAPSYTTLKNYYDSRNGSTGNYYQHWYYAIDSERYKSTESHSGLDEKQGRFQILFISTDKIANQNYLTIDYKTYGTLPTTEGSTNTYKNNAKITASSEMSAEHVEVKEKTSITLKKEIQEEPNSDNYVEPANWWYSSNADRNIVGYRIRATYNPDADKQIIVIKDTIPAGMEYVAGSGKVTQNRYVKKATTFEKEDVDLDSSKYSVSYDESTRTITVTITDYDTTTGIMPAFGTDWGPYAIDNVGFFYKAKLTDGAWNDKTTTQKRYGNTAWIDGSSDEVTAVTNFLRPSDNTTKGSVRITDYDSNNQAVTDTQHEMYYLIINPQSKDLDANSDRLSVEDTITVPDNVSAEFIYDEVKVYKFADQIPKNPSADDLKGTEVTDFTYTYDEHTHKLSLDVPDGQGLVIVYGYRYATTNTSTSKPSVTNTATIKGVDDSTSGDSITIDANDSSATVTQRNLKVRKIEEGNAGKLLTGSEFELVRYEANRDSTGKLDTSSNIGTKTTVGTVKSSDSTPDEGVATIVLQNVIGTTGTSSSDDVAPYTLFAFTEIKAPTGYKKSTDTYYFAWKDINDSDDDAYTKLKNAYNKAKQAGWPDFPAQADITFAANTGTINVGNTPQDGPETYSLTIKKETEKPSDEEFEFSLSFSTWNGSMYNTYELDSTPQGATKDEYGRYAFKLKNGESLTILDLPADVKYYVYEKPKTGWELISINGENADASWVENTIEDKDETVTFLNGELTTLTIKKTTENNKTGSFKFKVKLWTISYGPKWKAPAKPGSRLKAPADTGTKVPYELDPVPTGFTKTADGEYEVTISNGGSVSIPDLPRHVFYEISEETPTGWELVSVDGDTSKSKAEGEITGDTEVTFHNQKETTEISGTKTWVDDGRDHVNKDEITLTLKRSVEGGTAQTVPASEYTLTWTGNTYKLTGLPKVDDNNKEYTYTVEEGAITNYSSSQSGNNFTNTRDKGKFTIEKAVTGNAADTSKEFTFTITLKDDKGNGVTGTYSGVQFANGTGTVKLKHGDKKEIETWVGYTYEITENADGYTADKTKESGTVAKDTNPTYKFTNTLNTYGDLAIKKTVAGNDPNKVSSFKFTVTAKNPDDTPLTGQFGDFIFNNSGVTQVIVQAGQTVTIPKLPNGTKYVVTEESYSNDGYEPVVLSSNATGTIQGGENSTVTVSATNTRNTYGDLAIKKVETGNDKGKVTEFEFTVTATEADGTTPLAGTFGDYTFTDGKATVKVKAGETKTISKLPNGAKYTVTEKDYSGQGYDAVSMSNNASGTIVGNADVITVTATNNRDTYGDLAIKKVETGNDTGEVTDFEFTVTATEADGTTPLAGTFGDYTFTDGKATVKVKAGETKTIKNLPNGSKYTIEEADYTAKGYVEAQWSDEEGAIINGTQMSGTITGGQGTNSTVSFTATNHRDTWGDIVIKKELSGNTPDFGKEFEFTVTLDDTTFNEVCGDVTFKNGVGTVKLKGTKSAKIENLPNGVGYTITEADYTSKDSRENGYEAVVWSSTDNPGAINGKEVKGTIVGGQDTNTEVSYTATNERNTYGDLSITKKLTGNDTDPEKEFTFTVTISNGSAPVKNRTFGDYTTDENGQITITLKGGETKTITGIDNSYIYDVVEADYSDGDDGTKDAGYDAVDWEWDDTEGPKWGTPDHPHAVMVGTVGENTKMEIVATNHRDTYGDINLRKLTEGNDPDRDDLKEFTFTITAKDKDGNPIEGEFGDVTFEDGKATVNIANEDGVSVEGLPNGTTYEITEEDYSQYGYEPVVFSIDDREDATVTDDEAKTSEDKTTLTGTIIGSKGEDGNSLIEFTATNHRDTYGDIEIVKKITGNDIGSDKETKVSTFVITVFNEDGSENKDFNETLKDSNDQDVTFAEGVATVNITGEDKITIKGFPNGTLYTIEETTSGENDYDDVEWSEDPLNKEISGGDTKEANSLVSYTATNNRDTYGAIILKKVVEGNDVDEDTEFEFTIKATDAEGNAITGEHEDATFANGEATVKIAADDVVVISELPNGTTYEISEKDYSSDGYEPVVFIEEGSEDKLESVTGTIAGVPASAETGGTVVFTAINHRDTYGDLVVEKKLEGVGADTTKDFSFTVDLQDETIQGKFGDMEFTKGVATFTLKGGESAKAVGLPNGTDYTVSEEDYSVDRYETEYDGNEEGTIKGNTTVTTVVTNTYIPYVEPPTPPENPPRTPDTGKKVNGKESIELKDMNDTLTYTIYTSIPEDTVKMEITDNLVDALEFISGTKDVKVTVDGKSVVDQADITISGSKLTVILTGDVLSANTGKEVIVEFDAKIKSGTDLSKYTTTGVNNVAEIRINDSPDVFTTTNPAKVTPPSTPGTPGTPTKSSGPKTGDQTDIALYVMLLALSALGVGGMIASGRKEKENRR